MPALFVERADAPRDRHTRGSNPGLPPGRVHPWAPERLARSGFEPAPSHARAAPREVPCSLTLRGNWFPYSQVKPRPRRSLTASLSSSDSTEIHELGSILLYHLEANITRSHFPGENSNWRRRYINGDIFVSTA